MPPAAPAKRLPPVLSESTLLPLGFVLAVVVSFAGMAKWIGTIDAQQEHERELDAMLVDQLKALTSATAQAAIDAAATRAQVEMIVRELDRRHAGK